MIRREADAVLANHLSALPGVFANVSYDGRPIDWSRAVDTCHVLSNGEDAVQVWELKGDRAWEVMTIFGPTCRGRRAIDTGRAMVAYMMPLMDRAFGSVPDRLPAARWFYRQIGARPVDCVETAIATYTANPGETMFELVPARVGAIRLTRDAALLNRIANEPSVRPNIGYGASAGLIDLSHLADAPGMVFLHDGDDAVMAFEQSVPMNPDAWEKHNLFGPGCRGRRAIETGKAMLSHAFRSLSAALVWAQTPISNRAARWFNRQIGMTSRGAGLHPLLGETELFAIDRRTALCLS